MKKQEVCRKSINEFSQNKKHKFGFRKLMILVSPITWMEEDYQETWGQNVALEQLGDKTMKLHSKTKDGTLKCENQ